MRGMRQDWIVRTYGRRYNASRMSRRLHRSSASRAVRRVRKARRPHDPRPLLLARGLPSAEVDRLLAPYGFQDAKRADANLQAMAGDPESRRALAEVMPLLLNTIAQTADPDQALDQWERFLQNGVSRLHLFGYLRQAPRILELLCRIFGNSPALAQTLVRDPTVVYWLAEEQVLAKGPSRAVLDRALRTILRNIRTGELKREALRRFRRREMLRIGIRDLLRLADVVQTTQALSDVAAVLIQAAYEIARSDLQKRFGLPMHRARGSLVETGFAVIAMGKLGGEELNYSSDVDLIYVYETDDGAATSLRGDAVPNEEFFEYLSRDLTRALADSTQEGHVFRVDLRLRAEGSVGRLARPLRGYQQYYRTRGQTWERMALLKAWPVAGDRRVGAAFVRMIRSFVYDGTPGGQEHLLLNQIRSIKEMIDDKIARRGETTRNVKLGTGGIREIEFIVQALQIIYGGRLPAVRERSTLAALEQFRRHRILSAAYSRRLVDAYRFLRDVEHKLQMVHDLQTHALPGNSEEIGRCAVRLGYPWQNRQVAAQRLLADHERHTSRVNKVFRSLFYGKRSPLLGAARKILKETD